MLSLSGRVFRRPTALLSLTTTIFQGAYRSSKPEDALINRLRSRSAWSRRSVSTGTPKPASNLPSGQKIGQIYHGPLASTYRNLKIFSLSGLALSSMFTPLIFIIESSLPLAPRFALAGITMLTGTLSTVLVAWCGRPYVSIMRMLTSADTGGVQTLEMITTSMFLKPRVTRVYDSQFLVGTKRPFATWELAENIVLPTSREMLNEEETVAETFDEHGRILGKWIVRWGNDGKGTCYGVGKIIRHFNVHTELLHQ